MGALSILIGGIEHRDYIQQETIRILSSGSSLAATCTFTVEDGLGEAPWINIVEKQDILIIDAAFPAAALFGGKVAYIEEEHDGPRKTWKVRGSDYTIMLDETIAEYVGGTGETDQDIIVGVFAGTPISAVATPAGFVQLVYGVMEQTAFSGVTLREALADLARKTGGSYYVDFYQRLHWFALDEGDDAPFNLSTEPDYVTLYPYGQYKRSRDATILVNRVQVANYRGIAVWRDDLLSQAEPWGILEFPVRDGNINTVEEAEAYGDWFLSRHAWPKGEPECVCWRPGLRAGMRIQITNSVWGFGPTWYSIRRMELKCTGGTETLVDGLGHIRDPQYEVKLSMGLNDAPGRPDVQPNPDYSPAPPYPPGPPYDEPNPPVTGGTVEVLAEDGSISKVYYATDFLTAAPTWVGVSTGIPASRFTRMVLDPWETDRAVICGADGLYMNDAVKNGGAWSQIFSEVDFEALLGLAITNFDIRDVHFSITQKGSIWALVFFHDPTMADAVKDDLAVVHSHDYGVTWYISNRCIGLISTDNIWDSGCDLEVSQHNPDFVWYAVARVGFGAGRSQFMESTDGGHTFVYKSKCGDYADPSNHIHVPYDNNDDDLIIWVYGSVIGWFKRLCYSINRGTTWAEKSDGVAICSPARGGHNLISNNANRDHVYAANTNQIGGYSLNFHFSKDEGATWPSVARPVVPNSFAILPQAIPNMVLYLGEASNKTGHGPFDYIAARSSQDDGATWVDRTGNLVALMDADGLGDHRFIDTITPDWLLPGVEEYPPPGEYYEPDGPEALTGYLTPAQHTAIGNGAPHHAPVTLGGGSDAALALAGQQLTLADVLTPAEHTAIGNGAPHHAAVTLGGGSDAALALAGQQLTLADVLTPAEHTAIGDGAPHHAQAHTLASHSTKAHTELTGVTADQHHAQVHGAADHTDRTRNLWLSAAAFVAISGSPTLTGVHSTLGSAWLFDDSLDEMVAAEKPVPEDWASGTVALKIHYTMAGANASKAVRMAVVVGSFADGESMAAYHSDGADNVSCPDTANVLDIYTHSVVLTVAAGELMQIRLHRRADSAYDTAAGDMQFLGMELEYTADM